MKKTILLLAIAFIASLSFAQTVLADGGMRIPDDTVNSRVIKIGKSGNLSVLYYSDTSKFCGEHIEISTGSSLTPYISLSRLDEFDSTLHFAFEKYKEWSKLADSIKPQPFKKTITTFKADGGMISDYGYSSVSNVEIKFEFIRTTNYDGISENILQIKSGASDEYSVRHGSFLLDITDPILSREYWEVFIDNNRVKVYEAPKKGVKVAYHYKPGDWEFKIFSEKASVAQQISAFRKMIDPNRIIKLTNSLESETVSFK
jgi:hypothetical protein